jgi:hypothetical protein
MAINVALKERHTINMQQAYATWGLAGCGCKELAVHAGVLTAQLATEDEIRAGVEIFLCLGVGAPSFKRSFAAMVPHYQGPNCPAKRVLLLRYTRTGEIELGGEHISATINLDDGKVLGYCRMLKECDGRSFVDINTALRCAFHFLKSYASDLCAAQDPPLINLPPGVCQGQGISFDSKTEGTDFEPGFSMGKVSVLWVDDHQEVLSCHGKVFETHGMKVKMSLNDHSGQYAWVIVDKFAKVQVFERNIYWDFNDMRRDTQMWLHDGWLQTWEIHC